jgi:hypothetical protein
MTSIAVMVTATTMAIAQGCSSDGDEATASTPGDFFGVIPQTPLGDEDFARMAQGKIDTIRVVLPWAAVQPTADAAAYDFSSIDSIVLGGANQGIEVVPTLFGTPAWVANELDGEDCEESECSTFAPTSQKALAAWGDFVAAAVERYGPNGSIWSENPDVPPHPVHDWQIWNEQNSPTFYQPAPDVTGYERVLSTAADEIRSRDPKAQIVLGGMFGSPFKGEPPAYKAWAFLRELYAIPGAQDDFDGVAAHPYGAKIHTVESQVELMHDEIVRAGDDEASIWITEIGWASGGPDVPLNRGVDGQAQELTDSFNLFLDKRVEWNIDSVTWYSWKDTTEPVCDWCMDSGLFTTDSEPKPAWNAFVSFTGGS